MVAAVVWKHCFGEACSAISTAVAVAGVRVAAGAAADSAAVVVALVLEEVSVVVAILVEVARAAVGKQGATDSTDEDGYFSYPFLFVKIRGQRLLWLRT